MKLKTMLAAAALPLMALPTAAYAQDDAEAQAGPISLDFTLAALTDYRFRGLSLSGKDPEITAEIDVAHESGLYATVWASNVALDGDGKGNDAEIDFIGGFSKDVGNVNFDVGIIYYTYVDHSDFNYYDLLASVTVPVGKASVTVGGAYAPKQGNIGDQDNSYVYIKGDMPIGDSPLSVHGTFGYEDGAFADHKKDWALGASYDLGGGFSASLDYIDTAHALTPLGDATAVFSISKSF